MFESFGVPDSPQSGKSNALLDEYVQVQWKPGKAEDIGSSEVKHKAAGGHQHGATDKHAKPPAASEAQPAKSIAMALAAQAEYAREITAPHADKGKVLDHRSLKFQGAIDQADDHARKLSEKLAKELDALTPEKRQQAHQLFDLTVTAQQMAMSTVKPEERASVREEIGKARQGDKDALADLTKRYPFIPMALKASEESAKQFGPVLAKENEMLGEITSAAKDEINARLIFAQTIHDAGMDPSNYVKEATVLRDKLAAETGAAIKYMSPKLINPGAPEHEQRRQDERKADDG